MCAKNIATVSQSTVEDDYNQIRLVVYRFLNSLFKPHECDWSWNMHREIRHIYIKESSIPIHIFGSMSSVQSTVSLPFADSDGFGAFHPSMLLSIGRAFPSYHMWSYSIMRIISERGQNMIRSRQSNSRRNNPKGRQYGHRRKELARACFNVQLRLRTFLFLKADDADFEN